MPSGLTNSSSSISPGCVGGRSLGSRRPRRGSSGRRSAIVRDLDIEGIAILPVEAKPVVLVDPNARTPRAVALRTLASIPWGDSEVAQVARPVQSVELAPRDPPERNWTRCSCPPRIASVEDVLGGTIGERGDHARDHVICSYALSTLAAREHTRTDQYDAPVDATRRNCDALDRALDRRSTGCDR